MAQPSAYEQYLLELVNRGRLDPAAEALRHANDLNEGLPAGTISVAAKQPLAFNFALIDAARAHSQWMLDSDVFSHTGAGGSNPGDRMKAAGYVFGGAWNWGENIAWAGTTGKVDLAAYVRQEHKSLFLSEGHRQNTMNPDFQEVGLGVLQGAFTQGGTNYNAVMTTENFARSGSKQFLTGVAYLDADNDRFYTPGGGLAGVTVSVRAIDGAVRSTTTMDAGGHQQVLPGGACDVTISGASLPADLHLGLSMGTENVKLDLFGASAVQSSASLWLGENLRDASLLGVADLSLDGNSLHNTLAGNSGANDLYGQGGYDWLTGGNGSDRLYGGSGGDVLDGGNGHDQLVGSEGNDWLIGGIGGDLIWGGAGADTFVLTGGWDSCRAWGIDWISGFVCGTDRFDVPAANLAAGLGRLSVASATSLEDLYAALAGAAPNAMVDVSVGAGARAGHFLFINDGNAAASATGDALVQLSSLTGTLALSDFV